MTEDSSVRKNSSGRRFDELEARLKRELHDVHNRIESRDSPWTRAGTPAMLFVSLMLGGWANWGNVEDSFANERDHTQNISQETRINALDVQLRALSERVAVTQATFRFGQKLDKTTELQSSGYCHCLSSKAGADPVIRMCPAAEVCDANARRLCEEFLSNGYKCS